MTTLPIFSTVAEARAAIDHDKLATVYHRADSVFVATAHGTGTFSRHDWDARPDAPPAPSAPPDCLPFRRQE